MKKYKIFLDDIRELKDAWAYTGFTPFLKEKWIIVRNYNEFISLIESKYKENYFPEFIAFDHDLADEHYAPEEYWGDKYKEWSKTKNFQEKTGLDCAKWLIDFCMDNKIKLPEYIVHSMNPVGKKNIESLLNNYINKVEHI